MAKSLIPVLVLLALAPVAAWAFHEDGVANCDGCHVMHATEEGMVVVLPGSTDALLRFATGTDACLSCHASELGSVMGSDPQNPPAERGGGNFVFLLEDNINDATGGLLNPIAGHRAGHSVVSPDWGLSEDIDHPMAPGGTYRSSDLGCTSCHDPHGNGNFRMLYGAGQTAVGDFLFTRPAPRATGIALEGVAESATNHTAYNADWSEWCSNCHGLYHDVTGDGFEHPVRETLGSDESDVYNFYNGDADPTGGSASTAFIAEVPFEDTAMTTSSTTGPSTLSEINCLTCHRAHASSAVAAGRWDFSVYKLADDGYESGSYGLRHPYASDPDQRSLCLKCHWDEVGEEDPLPGEEDHDGNRPCMECHSDPEALLLGFGSP